MKTVRAMEQIARAAALTPGEQAAPQPASSSAAAAGGTVASTGTWVSYGLLDLTTLGTFYLA